MRRSSLLVASLLIALVAAACGSAGSSSSGSAAASPSASGAASGPSVLPVFVNSLVVKGPFRFLFSFIDAASNLPAAAPDRSVSVSFIAPGASAPGAATPATFIWAIEGSRGIYMLHTEFPAAGDWTAVFATQAPGKPQETINAQFQVQESGPTVQVGQPAPKADTPTAADVGGDLAKLSSDTKPDPSFYTTSESDALAARTPFVLVFATPAFCRSAQCGPTLDRVKALAKTAPKGVTFINVEPYQLAYSDGRLQPVLDPNGQLQTVPAADAWGIVTEPWIFAVDAKGTVKASFEGVVGDDELAAAVKDIAGS
jgi:hypothetical protein